MAYFHGCEIRSIGGRKRRRMRRIVGETLEEMRRLGRVWPENVLIYWPPRRNQGKTGKLEGWIDEDRDDVLEELNSAEVSPEYLTVLTYLLRKAHWANRGRDDEEMDKFFERNIRGSISTLLRSRTWVDEPENEGLRKLNERLKDFDLGRRDDLKYSSVQDEDLKYDRFREIDSNPRIIGRSSEYQGGLDWDTRYRNAGPLERAAIIREKPFLAYLRERYPDPEGISPPNS